MMRISEELRCAIADQVDDVQDLQSLRLASRLLLPAATRAMFSSVRIYQTTASLARFNRIRKHPTLKTFVKHLEINTVDTLQEYRDDDVFTLDDQLCAAFKAGFTAFRGLTTTSLNFSPRSADFGFNELHWTIYCFCRWPILLAFFAVLEKPEAARIKYVRIENLHNLNFTRERQLSWPKKPASHNVLSRLEALRLYIAVEDRRRQHTTIYDSGLPICRAVCVFSFAAFKRPQSQCAAPGKSRLWSSCQSFGSGRHART